MEIGLSDLDGKNQDDPVNKGAFHDVLARWVMCDAPGTLFNDVILKRGHLAVLEYDDGNLTLVEMNAAP